VTALCHAMSLMATSGISPVGGLGDTGSGIWGEVILFLFFVFALSRITFSSDTVTGAGQTVLRDPEFRLGALILLGVPTVLFLRHWVGAFELDEVDDLQTALRAFWGALFTATSFLTTTGFVSTDWDTAQAWSGLPTPSLILMGLALVGGGVATTAGGVKLLRVFVLYLNGLREMERLVHPSSVSGAGPLKRRIRRQGAYIAWIFFMLFAISLAVIAVVFAALGLGFQNALVLSVAALSTTGPLISVATEPPVVLADLGAAAKAVLAGAMILGRLETLAIIALFSPSLWRN
jgi:Trk-type K+ transport systems, membrane components